MADNPKISQIKLPNGSTYDIKDNISGYITLNDLPIDQEIPVSRIGDVEIGDTVGTESTNLPTSKAVVDYVEERLEDEIGAIDIPVESVNGKTGQVVLTANDVGAASQSYVDDAIDNLWIPTSTSQLTNDSGFITSYSDEKLAINFFSHSSTNSAIYYPILGKNGNSISTAARRNYDSEFKYEFMNGTTVDLSIGSSKFTGRLVLKKNGIITRLIPSATTSADITLPAITGTIALTSDIPAIPTNISAFTNDSGYLTSSDIASVLTYKGTKTSVANLPSTGNKTGDVWHITADGSEYAWDGSIWQELGTAIDLSGYATKATTLAGYGITDAKIENGTITLGSNSITPLTSFTETDPVFSASAAAGITSTDISNWNAKVSDDKTWNNKSLSMSTTTGNNFYVPRFNSTSADTAYLILFTATPTASCGVRYDGSAYIYSTTPSANDNSTKVATTAYVDAAIPKVYSSTNTGGYLTMATLPIYDGTVV